MDVRVKYEYGTIYSPDRIAYSDAEVKNIKNYHQLTDKQTIFKKMGEKSDYIIQPKAMLHRGTYCVTELYSSQTRKLLVERLI